MATGQFYTQGEIDTYFWNYCIGLLDLANASKALQTDEQACIHNMISLANGRVRAMAKAYDRPPSYTVYYTCNNGSFDLNRVDTKKL